MLYNNERLTPQQFEAVRQHLRMSYREVAELCDIPKGTVRDYAYGRCTFERRPEYHSKLVEGLQRQYDVVVSGMPVKQFQPD